MAGRRRRGGRLLRRAGGGAPHRWLGIYVGEHLRTGDTVTAWRATRATIAGFGIAVLVQFAAAMSMIAVWVVWVIID